MKESINKWWAEYDLDGSFDFYFCEDQPMTYSHALGPFETFKDAKKEVIFAFRNCMDELRGGINAVKERKEF